MLDPLSPMFSAHAAPLGQIVRSATDPGAAHGLMVFGVSMIAAIALWAVGGLGAAIWSYFSERAEHEPRPVGHAMPRPSRR
jgi:hypothetical protein